MSMRPAALAAVILATAAPRARAGQFVDGTSNTILVGEIAAQPVELLKAPGLPWMRYDVVARLQNPQPLIGVSQSAAGLAVHSGGGGSAPVTTALFFPGSGTVANAPFTLRDQASGLVTPPSAVRTLAVDPSDPGGGAVLLSAGHVALPASNQVRGVNFVRDASGEAVLVDYDLAGGAPRRTPLGLTAPLGSTKGSVVASPDGRSWATLPYDEGVALFALGDLAGQGALAPVLVGTLPVSASFDPASTHLGIIAVLIGLLVEPAPSLSIQEGNRLRLYAHDGDAFRLVAEQTLIPNAHGLMEEEGIAGTFFYYLSGGNLWRGVVGGGPGTLVNLGH
jgi:hypothetical protein